MKFFRFVYSSLALILLGCILHAKAPWGILYDAEEPSFSVRAINNLIEGRSIRYAINDVTTPQQEAIFLANIQKWPQEVVRLIKRSNRAQEFQDILPMLERKLVLQRVDVNAPPDIYLVVQKYPPCGGSDACVVSPDQSKKPFEIIYINPKTENFSSALLHEIGHYYGLGDQYEESRLNSHDEYSSNVNHQEKALMQGSDTQQEITCDDADGFINLLDLRLAQRRNKVFSKRAQQGWKSLCPKSSNMYQNAKTINRKEDVTFDDEDSQRVFYYQKYDNKGNMISDVEYRLAGPLYVFSSSKKDTVVRDPANRVTSIEGVLSPAEEGQAAPIRWKREFSYGRPSQDGRIEVQVTESIGNVRLAPYSIWILKDGGVEGDVPGWFNEEPVFALTASEYYAQVPGARVRLDIQNGQIINPRVQDIKTGDVIFWEEKTNRLNIKRKGKETVTLCSVSPENTCTGQAKRYFSLMKVHRRHLRSFYRNFYKPLFKPTQEQIKDDLKKSLSKR